MILYCTFIIAFIAPTYGSRTPLIYISVGALVGSLTVSATQSLGVAVTATFAGDNQFTLGATWLFIAALIICLLVQMNFFTRVRVLLSLQELMS